MKKSWIVICGLWIALVAAVMPMRAETAAKPKAEAPKAEARGLLIPYEEVLLSSRSKGVIQSIKEEGTQVQTGDIVMELENDAEKLAVEERRKILEKSEFDGKSYAKMQQEKVVSDSEALDARVKMDLARLQLSEAEVALDKRVLRSPISGVVTRRLHKAGEAIDEFAPALVVVNISKVYLETYLPSARFTEVKVGQPVEISVATLPGKKFTGTIEFIAPVIDPASNEFRIKVLLPNENGELRSGMSAVGKLPPPDVRQAEEKRKSDLGSRTPEVKSQKSEVREMRELKPEIRTQW